MKRILLVDDSMVMRKILSDILTANGYEICGEAADGVDAVRKYNELKPDLVTMDITMPNMDGIAALRKIKENNPDANCIMCSSMGQEPLLIEAVQCGAKDFIIKPFKADKILRAVRHAI